MSLASAVGWYFMSEGWRGKISGAASVALRGDKQEIKKYFKDTVLPQDPAKRRTVFLQELKKSLAEIKKENAGGSVGKDFIVAAEEVVKGLEEANHDKTLGREVSERIINKILPVEDKVDKCEN